MKSTTLEAVRSMRFALIVITSVSLNFLWKCPIVTLLSHNSDSKECDTHIFGRKNDDYDHNEDDNNDDEEDD